MEYIGVIGARTTLPDDFPLSFAENAGNLVHAQAPFGMFSQCVHSTDDLSRFGYKDFAAFVNEKCSHLIVTMANTLRIGDKEGERYSNLRRMLGKYKKPVVIFGLGAQAKELDIGSASLHPEAIKLLQDLSGRCPTIGVRGEFTADVVRRVAGVSNVHVLGCPSLFSNPVAIETLYHNLKSPLTGRPAYAGTTYWHPPELEMLMQAINNKVFLIEPVNKHLYGFHIACARGEASSAPMPYFLRGLIGKRCDFNTLSHFFLAYFRTFRRFQEWRKFNEEAVSFTYGTRFHVNMASLLSGRPAVWVKHDARTSELVDFLCLPYVELRDAALMEPKAFRDRISYDAFFSKIGDLFDNFNGYLKVNGLPLIRKPFSAKSPT